MDSFSARFCIYLMRGILLSCLLTGLLCSSGEGIRLFPLPDAERASVSSVGKVFVGFNSFQFGGHRFEKSEGACTLKFHERDTEKSDGNASLEIRFSVGPSHWLSASVHEPGIVTASASFDVPSGRAPPVSDPQNS